MRAGSCGHHRGARTTRATGPVTDDDDARGGGDPRRGVAGSVLVTASGVRLVARRHVDFGRVISAACRRS